ncbi:MAG TPA: glycosyltransferase [Chloroflexota bacterium]|jgi:glycosyltransferase involved in cell wall biosynthesis|nr:glycosyltransferase [Chloroflexota bacterium]
MSAIAAYPVNPLAPPEPDLRQDLLSGKRVAIVAERLIDMRGGERVVTAVADMIPHADIYATVVGDKGLPDFGGRRVHTSFVQGLPGAKRFFRAYLPLYPMAVEHLDLQRYDVVVSLSSAFAHGALTSPETTHVCYCHTPLRFAWNYQHAYSRSSNPLVRSITTPLLHYVRSWDVAASHRVDAYVANSRNVQRRLWKYYRRESTVIHPPVDTSRFFPIGDRGDHYLIVSALNAYKRVDIAVAAFSRLGLPLYVVGSGPDEARLRSRAADNVKFLGRVSETDLARLYATCKAFVFTSDDDFGISPVEAQAAGRPVIAYGAGGAIETVEPGVTGVLFSDQTAACLEDTIQSFDPDAYRPAAIRAHAMRFSADRFQHEFGRFLEASSKAPGAQERPWPTLQVL